MCLADVTPPAQLRSTNSGSASVRSSGGSSAAANSDAASKAAIKAVHTLRVKGEAAHDKHLYAHSCLKPASLAALLNQRLPSASSSIMQGIENAGSMQWDSAADPPEAAILPFVVPFPHHCQLEVKGLLQLSPMHKSIQTLAWLYC